MIGESWDDAADEAHLTVDEHRYLSGRQILNPYAFTGYN